MRGDITVGRDVSQHQTTWVIPVVAVVLFFAAWVLTKQGGPQSLSQNRVVEFNEQDLRFLQTEFPDYVLPLERARLGELLSDAIEAGDNSEAVRLLNVGADADWSGPKYATQSSTRAPLFLAIKRGNPTMVAALLQHGVRIGGPTWADVNTCRNEFGQTPLYFAVRCRQHQIVDLLLDHGAMVVGTNSSGKTPVVAAVEAADLDLFNELVRKGAVCDFESSFYADRHSSWDPAGKGVSVKPCVLPFAETITSSLNLRELALRSRNQQLIAAVDKQFRKSPQFSPHRVAELVVRNGHVDSLRSMMASGYDPSKYSTKNDDTTTLLDVAAKHNRVKCFTVLKQQGISQTQHLAKATVLRLLVASGSVEELQRRLAAGAKFAPDQFNRGNPLELAVRTQREEMVHYLLQLPEAKATWLRVPGLLPGALPYASLRRSRSICKALIKAGVTIPSTAADSSGNPLLRAAAGGWIDVYEMLARQAPALVNHSEALEMAVRCDQTDMCRYLLNQKPGPNVNDWPVKQVLHYRNEKVLRLFVNAGVKRVYPEQFDVSRGLGRYEEYAHPLYHAALNGDTKFCRRIIQQFPGSAVWQPIKYEPYEYDNDIEYFDKGNTPLFAAVFRDHVETLRLLLSYTKRQDQNGKPLLDINAQNAFGATALHMAVMYGSSRCTQLLIASGADVTIPGNTTRWGEGNSLLHLAARDPFASHHHKSPHQRADVNDIVPMLIAANVRVGSGDWINQKNRWQKTPLHLHAAAVHHKACQMLIAHGAGVNATGEHGATVLSSAIRTRNSFYPAPEKERHERSRLCICLIDAGAKFTGRTYNGHLSYSTLAYRNGLFGFVEELQRRGVVPDLATEAGEYLCSAVFHNDHEALKRWIAQGADVNAHSVDGDTALHKAARSHDVAACRILLAEGADPNLIGEDEAPVLFSVFRQFHNHTGSFYRPELEASAASILKMLLDAGANPLITRDNKSTKKNKTILDAFDKMPVELRKLIEARM